jgi:hypothetical protein
MDFQLPTLVHLSVFSLGSWHVWCKICDFVHYNVQDMVFFVAYLKMLLWNYVIAWMVSDIFLSIILNTLVTNFQGGIMKDKLCEDDSP